MDAKLDAVKQQDRRKFNRKLVLFFHVLAAFFTAVIYLSQINLARFQYWRRGSSLNVLLIAAPPLLPYIISAVHSWRTATYDRLRVSLFLLVLILGAFGVGCALAGAFGFDLPAGSGSEVVGGEKSCGRKADARARACDQE